MAAAVFTEGHVEPIKIPPPVEHHHHHYRERRSIMPYYQGGGTIIGGGITYTAGNTGSIGGGTFSSNTVSLNNAQPTAASANYFCDEISDGAASASFDTLVSVGAGEHVDQKISYVTGLIKPTFTETVRVN